MKVTNGARPYKPLPNYLEEGNYEFRSKAKAAQRGAKRNKHLEAKEKLLKQDFEYCNEIAFIMEIREQKIINTKMLLSKRVYKRCDFSGNVVDDEEIEEAVISILDLVRDLKDFLDLPIYSKDFVKIAFEWQENRMFLKANFIQSTRKEKFRLKAAIYTQQCYAKAYKDLENVIALYCPKKYLDL